MIDEVRKQTELRIEQEKKIGVQEEKIRQLENEIVILKEDNLRSDLTFSQTEVRTLFNILSYNLYDIILGRSWVSTFDAPSTFDTFNFRNRPF